jgi:hypothetical protein
MILQSVDSTNSFQKVALAKVVVGGLMSLHKTQKLSLLGDCSRYTPKI